MARGVVVRKIRRPERPDAAGAGLREAFVLALAKDYAEHGAAAIAALRQDKPVDYVKLVASLLPKEVAADAQGEDDGARPMSIQVRFVRPEG